MKNAEIIQLDSHCEDRCIIGVAYYKESPMTSSFQFIIHDGSKVLNEPSFRVELFNVCPACGQELHIDVSVDNKHLKFEREF